MRGRGSDAAAAQRQRVTESEAFFFSLFPFLVLLLICSRCVFRERREAGECFFRCAFWRGKKGESVEERVSRNKKGRCFFHFSRSLSCLPLALSLSPQFRAEREGAARNEAARAVAAPRGGIAVDLCSSTTSAAAVSRSGGRENDAGSFERKEGDEADVERRRSQLLAKKQPSFADNITLLLPPQIQIRQSYRLLVCFAWLPRKRKKE